MHTNCRKTPVKNLRMSSETRPPVPPLQYRRSSSSHESKNLNSVSSSLLPAFGTVVDEGYLQLKKYVIAPYDRRYRWFCLLLFFYFLSVTQEVSLLWCKFKKKKRKKKKKCIGLGWCFHFQISMFVVVQSSNGSFLNSCVYFWVLWKGRENSSLELFASCLLSWKQRLCRLVLKKRHRERQNFQDKFPIMWWAVLDLLKLRITSEI